MLVPVLLFARVCVCLCVCRSMHAINAGQVSSVFGRTGAWVYIFMGSYMQFGVPVLCLWVLLLCICCACAVRVCGVSSRVCAAVAIAAAAAAAAVNSFEFDFGASA